LDCNAAWVYYGEPAGSLLRNLRLKAKRQGEDIEWMSRFHKRA